MTRRGSGAAVIVPFAILILIYLPSLYDLVLDWYHDSNYSHGFLVPLVSAYLVWQKRAGLKQIPKSTDRLGLAVILAGLLLFVFGNGAAEYFTVRFSFVVCLAGLILYLFGRQFTRKIWFELFFLLFMIPIPYVIYYSLTFPMQILASKISASALNIIGLGVVRQGNILHIQGYSLEVAEACSGMRSLVSLLALGALYAYLTQRSFWAKATVFLSTIPIAVAANVFRVFLTALLASTVTQRVTDEPLHSFLGLTVFVIAFILLFIAGFIVKRIDR